MTFADGQAYRTGRSLSSAGQRFGGDTLMRDGEGDRYKQNTCNGAILIRRALNLFFEVEAGGHLVVDGELVGIGRAIIEACKITGSGTVKASSEVITNYMAMITPTPLVSATSVKVGRHLGPWCASVCNAHVTSMTEQGGPTAATPADLDPSNMLASLCDPRERALRMILHNLTTSLEEKSAVIISLQKELAKALEHVDAAEVIANAATQAHRENMRDLNYTKHKLQMLLTELAPEPFRSLLSHVEEKNISKALELAEMALQNHTKTIVECFDKNMSVQNLTHALEEKSVALVVCENSLATAVEDAGAAEAVAKAAAQAQTGNVHGFSHINQQAFHRQQHVHMLRTQLVMNQFRNISKTLHLADMALRSHTGTFAQDCAHNHKLQLEVDSWRSQGNSMQRIFAILFSASFLLIFVVGCCPSCCGLNNVRIHRWFGAWRVSVESMPNAQIERSSDKKDLSQNVFDEHSGVLAIRSRMFGNVRSPLTAEMSEKQISDFHTEYFNHNSFGTNRTSEALSETGSDTLSDTCSFVMVYSGEQGSVTAEIQQGVSSPEPSENGSLCSGQASWISAAAPFNSPEARCFLTDALVHVVKIAEHCTTGTHLVPVSKLQKNDIVHGLHSLLQVYKINIKQVENCSLVQLDAGENIPKLTVTTMHRSVVPGDGPSTTTQSAGSLKPGDRIKCSSGVRTLRFVGLFTKDVDVVEVFLKPDEPIEAFDAPYEKILSKGQARIRRGGVKKRHGHHLDLASIAGTDWTWSDQEMLDEEKNPSVASHESSFQPVALDRCKMGDGNHE